MMVCVGQFTPTSCHTRPRVQVCDLCCSRVLRLHSLSLSLWQHHAVQKSSFRGARNMCIDHKYITHLMYTTAPPSSASRPKHHSSLPALPTSRTRGRRINLRSRYALRNVGVAGSVNMHECMHTIGYICLMQCCNSRRAGPISEPS